MGILLHLLVASLAILAGAYLLGGVRVDGFLTALLTAIVLGLLNIVVKPLLLLLTLPINILTLGLFTFVINALLILLAGKLVPGFHVDGFWWALLFGLLVSLMSAALNLLRR